MRTRFSELLSLEYPIVQAPMAGVSTPALAAAVSNAGGLGTVAIGAMDAASADAALTKTGAATNGPFGVNVFCHGAPRRDAAVEAAWCDALRPLFASVGAEAPAQLTEIYRSIDDDDDVFDVLLAHRPRVVSFHFGVPRADRIRALKSYGAVLLATATSVKEARVLVDAGIDVIVAQGFEAGGHHGPFLPDTDRVIGTLPLVRQIATTLRAPVLAAGGIMDGAGIAAALALGAEGAQLGTAFITSTESLASEGFRQRLLQGAPVQTTVTAAISGRAARGLANSLSRAVDALSARVPDYPIAYDATKALVAAATQRGADFAVQWCGQGGGFNRALAAAELVELLGHELEQELARLGSLV